MVFAGLASAPAAFCDQINVGDIFFIDNGNGTTQFYLDNFTGPNVGCSTPGGFPVCDNPDLSGTLSYSYQDGSNVVTGSATLADPIAPDDQNGYASYAPSNFLLSSDGTDILTATFLGSLTPVDFTTDVGLFHSDGTVLSADVVAGGGYALLYATSASAAVPEPSSAVLLTLGSLFFTFLPWLKATPCFRIRKPIPDSKVWEDRVSMKSRSASSACAILFGFVALAGQAVGQVRILSVAPATVQPGNTFVMTGSGFPAGVSAASVSVQFAPVTSGAGPTVTVPLGSLATLAGTTLRATVVIPASLVEMLPTPYHVSLSATVAPAFTTATPGNITINPPPSLSSVRPASGSQTQTINVVVTGSFSNFFQGISTANFGPGITVNSITVTSATSLTANITIAASAPPGTTNVVITTGSEVDTLTKGFTILPGSPTITSFAPQSGTTGTIVTINGSNFGSAPQVTMPGQSGGPVSLPLQSLAASSLSIVIPTGVATGPLTVTASGKAAVTASPFTINPASNFTISAAPGAANLIVGQTVALAVQLISTTGFSQLAPLSVSGLPAGVTASFKPSSITAGQTSVLTLSAPSSQPISTANLSISASATVSGIPVNQTASASLSIQGPTTSFLGRTVVSDSPETPLAGVTVTMMGLNGGGASTGCTGTTVSDSAGNFALTGLAANCVGPQLIGYNGNTVTSPAGKYAGVNLVYTLTSGQVTVSPVLVHLPRIDGAETFQVQQNAATDQTYSFASVPGVTVTVYAHTTFKMEDGTQPNPFPLVAIAVPVDRLPEMMPASNSGVMGFIVAFQPANVTASQPVAVSYPNTLNVAPGTSVPLMTLDPTLGRMVPYGTATVSADGTQIVPDIDPSTGALKHRFGIVHFDWHGWVARALLAIFAAAACFPVGGPGAAIACGLAVTVAVAAEPVDLSSGVHVAHYTDLSIQGARGSISVMRVYRSLSTSDGSFGIGTELQYAWQLDTANPAGVSAVNLISPEGNRSLFSLQADGTFRNSTVPSLIGVVMSTSGGQTNLRLKDGTLYQFQGRGSLSVLTAIVDRNGNTTTLTLTPVSAARLGVTQITDPVGRSINLVYDSNGHVVSATDPIGRTVSYAYTPSGYLATITDPAGGSTRFQYNSQNQLVSMVDPLGVTAFQDAFDANGRVISQTVANGGLFQFAYTLTNTLVPTSPVLATTVTDPLGNQTTYRFNPQGYLTGVTDAIGQTKSFSLDPRTNQILSVAGPAQCDACGPRGLGPQSFSYDASGNALTTSDALGNTTSFTYDPVFNELTSVTDPLNHRSIFRRDSSGNLTSITDANGNTRGFSYSSTGLLVQLTDPLGNTTSIVYDGSANPVQVTDALGNTSTTVFDGASRPVSIADPLGKKTIIGWDALDRTASVKNGKGNATSFTYDPVGDLLSLVDARGNSTAFGYDAAGRMTSRTSPTGKVETYTYDLDGNLMQYTDRRGQVSRYQYDQLNRLIKESYQDGATVTRSYDPYSRLLAVNDSIGGSFGFAYDLNGGLVSQTEPTGTINYTRDSLHRVTTRQVVGQGSVSYSYDPVGNLLNASMPGTGITWSYDARNLPVAASRTNGVASSYLFDPLGRVLSLIYTKGGTALNTQTYTYDSSGNRNSATNDISQPLITQAATATLDPANELLIKGQITYTNDANGNRLMETGPNGTIVYQWDSRNRLSSITDSSGNRTSFRYDFRRSLIEADRTTGGSTLTQRFVVDSVTNLVSLTDALGLPASVLTGRSIDSHIATVDSSGNVSFGVMDVLGSTAGVTNSTGVLTSKFEYEPYGLATGGSTASYPFSFTGRIPVEGSIFYFRNRFYDASTGTFLSEDPIGVAGGPNLYTYGSGNPISSNDPTGLCPTCLFGGAAGAIGGAIAGCRAGHSPEAALDGAIAGYAIGFLSGGLGVIAGDAAGSFFAAAYGAEGTAAGIYPIVKVVESAVATFVGTFAASQIGPGVGGPPVPLAEAFQRAIFGVYSEIYAAQAFEGAALEIVKWIAQDAYFDRGHP